MKVFTRERRTEGEGGRGVQNMRSGKDEIK
jgi:hypothetical protein